MKPHRFHILKVDKGYQAERQNVKGKDFEPKETIGKVFKTRDEAIEHAQKQVKGADAGYVVTFDTEDEEKESFGL